MIKIRHCFYLSYTIEKGLLREYFFSEELAWNLLRKSVQVFSGEKKHFNTFSYVIKYVSNFFFLINSIIKIKFKMHSFRLFWMRGMKVLFILLNKKCSSSLFKLKNEIRNTWLKQHIRQQNLSLHNEYLSHLKRIFEYIKI